MTGLHQRPLLVTGMMSCENSKSRRHQIIQYFRKLNKNTMPNFDVNILEDAVTRDLLRAVNAPVVYVFFVKKLQSLRTPDCKDLP